MIDVGHWGLHWADGDIAFLLQGSGSQHLLQLHLDCPFRVILRRTCNHNIQLDEPSDEGLIDDPLVRVMLPVPKPTSEFGVPYFIDPAGALKLPLLALARMSWPIRSIVHPAWVVDRMMIFQQLQTTNVQPLVITDCQPHHVALIHQLCAAAVLAPRQLILTGHALLLPASAHRMESSLAGSDLNGIDWEGIGARVLSEHMYGK